MTAAVAIPLTPPLTMNYKRIGLMLSLMLMRLFDLQ